MAYRIHEIEGGFYVQYRRGDRWLFYVDCQHIRFDTYDQAFSWIVEHKFSGNWARAMLRIV